ncbi:hypothetical protein SAMN02745223_02909 [Devosia limi DSM 17137]|uniref:Uncharacterized protein n=1 Tax=Devosia limi DSM 17137 TaxID=1121477 RepID=A0A1M5CGS8_9HYPH|nr:hypothetical protein SAMN02745223_02909 [Devosia limi DSM 17137]
MRIEAGFAGTGPRRGHTVDPDRQVPCGTTGRARDQREGLLYSRPTSMLGRLMRSADPFSRSGRSRAALRCRHHHSSSTFHGRWFGRLIQGRIVRPIRGGGLGDRVSRRSFMGARKTRRPLSYWTAMAREQGVSVDSGSRARRRAGPSRSPYNRLRPKGAPVSPTCLSAFIHTHGRILNICRQVLALIRSVFSCKRLLSATAARRVRHVEMGQCQHRCSSAPLHGRDTDDDTRLSSSPKPSAGSVIPQSTRPRVFQIARASCFWSLVCGRPGRQS